MKKIASVVLVFLFLCGCSTSNSNVNAILSGISFTAKISFYNEQFVCDGSIHNDGTLKLIVKEPENIEGMILTVNNGTVTAEYKGLTYTPNTGTFPFGSVAQYTYMVLSDAKQRLYPVKKTSDNYLIESAENDIYYKITLAPTGLPLSLEYPSKGLIISFMNLTIM